MSKDFEYDGDFEEDYEDEYEGLEIYDDFDLLTDDFDEEDFDNDFDYEHEGLKEVILTLEDDSELRCGVLAQFEIEGQDYIALLPLDDEGEVLLYRANYSEDYESFDVELIEDEDEFDLVADAYYNEVDLEDEDLFRFHSHDHDHDHDDGFHH